MHLFTNRQQFNNTSENRGTIVKLSTWTHTLGLYNNKQLLVDVQMWSVYDLMCDRLQ